MFAGLICGCDLLLFCFVLLLGFCLVYISGLLVRLFWLFGLCLLSVDWLWFGILLFLHWFVVCYVVFTLACGAVVIGALFVSCCFIVVLT